MYKRQIALGSAASAAFLAAGILAAGTAFASTSSLASTPIVANGIGSPTAVVSALPSVSEARGILTQEGRGVVGGTLKDNLMSTSHSVVQQVRTGQPSAQALAPVTSTIPGLTNAAYVIGGASSLASAVPGMNGGPNVVSLPNGQVTNLPGVDTGAGSVAQAAQSVTPGQLPGTVSGLGQAAREIPGGGSLSTLKDAVPLSQASAPLSGAAAPVSGATAPLSGLAGLMGGSGVIGNLPLG